MVFLYPLSIKFITNENYLLLDCYYIDNENKQRRGLFKKIPYFNSVKITTKNNYTDEEFIDFIKSKIHDVYLYHTKEEGYNLFKPNINEENNPTFEKIYKVYLDDDNKLSRTTIKKIEKNKDFLVVEEDMNYKSIKYQKDINIFLYQWNKCDIFENIITDIKEIEEKETPNNPIFNICCYDIETFYDEEKTNCYSKEYNDFIGAICLKLNDDKPIILLINTINQINTEYDDKIIITFKTEKDMIKYFVDNYFNNVDVIYGYNNIEFDDKCIIKRYNELHDEPLIINKTTIHYDLFKYIKNTYPNHKSHSLKYQMKEHLKIFDKLDLEYSELNKIFNSYSKSQKLDELKYLIDYNIRDVEGTYRLENKVKGFDNYLAVSCLSSVSITNFINLQISSVIEKYIYKILPSEIYIYNSNPNTEKFEGAFTDLTDDKKGFYRNVYPFDFASLYPSMIMYYNLSPDTINHNINNINNNKCFHYEFEDRIMEKEKCIKSFGIVKYNYFKSKYHKGFLTSLMEQLKERRNEYKRLKKINEIKYEPLQIAIKLIMNSIYGKLGEQVKNSNKTFTLSNRQLATTITSTGRDNIKLLQKLLQGIIPPNQYSLSYKNRDEKFMKIQEILTHSKFLYTDTDSVYIQLDKKIDINDIEKYYLGKLFKKPIYAEAEEVIRNINIVKKKNYIYQLDKDGNIKTKGWKKAEMEFIVNFHKDIFNTFCELENVNDIDKIIKCKYDMTLKKIDDDYDNLQDNINHDILKKYYVNEGVKKEQIYEDLGDELKINNYNNLLKICKNVNITEIIEAVKINEKDLGILKMKGDSYFINYLYNKKGIKLCDRINTIQLINYWNNDILKKIKRINKLPLDLIEGNIRIDKNYYKEALNKRIEKSISLTLIKSKPAKEVKQVKQVKQVKEKQVKQVNQVKQGKQVKQVKQNEGIIRKDIIDYLDVKIKECKNNFIKIKDLYDNYEGKKGRKKIFTEITLEIYKEQFKPKIEIKKKKYKNVLILKK